MVAGEFQLKQETLVATIEAYEQLAKELATYKEEQLLILDSVQNWDSELSQTFRNSYSKMLNERYSELEEKCRKITEILTTALEETNRLLNRRDGFPETLEDVMLTAGVADILNIPIYSTSREIGGILKLNNSLNQDIIDSCDEALELVEKEKLELDKLKSVLEKHLDLDISENLRHLEIAIYRQRNIENFKHSFELYCEGVELLDAYLTEELGKITEEYGDVLDVAGYRDVRLKGLDMKAQIEIYGKIGEPINGWLQLYNMMTVAEMGRVVSIPDEAEPTKWAMIEEKDTINPYALKAIEGSNEVCVGEKGELIDKEGRYWIAVGPCVMNPDHKLDEACYAEEMKYGTLIDVVIENEMGERFIIPCIVGEGKQHTYPNGIYQTGRAFPNGGDFHPENVDGSIIEFCGKASVEGLTKYSIVEIVVYDLED